MTDEAMLERLTQVVHDQAEALARYCGLPAHLLLPLHALAAYDQLQARMRIDWDPPTLQPQPQTLHIAGYTGPASTSPKADA